MARPSEYNLELCEEICERVALGENVVKILESDDKFPCFKTWCSWKRNNDELLQLYVNSVQDKSDVELKEMEEIQKELREGSLTPSQANVLIQTIKWKLAKFYPKMYGDKVEHDIKSSDGSMSPKTGLEGLTFEQLVELKYGKASE